jgi:hypothetical protein
MCLLQLLPFSNSRHPSTTTTTTFRPTPRPTSTTPTHQDGETEQNACGGAEYGRRRSIRRRKLCLRHYQAQYLMIVKDTNLIDNSETVYISSLALLKMLRHGRAGTPHPDFHFLITTNRILIIIIQVFPWKSWV